MRELYAKEFLGFTYCRYGDCSLLRFGKIAIYRRVGRLKSFRWVKMNGI